MDSLLNPTLSFDRVAGRLRLDPFLLGLTPPNSKTQSRLDKLERAFTSVLTHKQSKATTNCRKEEKYDHGGQESNRDESPRRWRLP